jgi:predicted dehydrogenase
MSKSDGIRNSNILVIGVGSIGVRHINNLLSLGFVNIRLVTKRKVFPDFWPKFKSYSTILEALNDSHFTHALICTPTSQHVNDLSQIINSSINSIFLEKPISHTFLGIDDLIKQIKNEQKIWLGYDLRFDLGLLQVKNLLEEKMIGSVLTVNSFVGQYLPDWRPHEDYRNGSSALLSKGGGVLLDLVHEFDYLFWFFGKVRTLAALYKNTDVLEIETEDIADVLLQFQNGVQGTLHLDYHQKKLFRNCVITGSKGTIKWDLGEKSVSLIGVVEEPLVWKFPNEERNQRFLRIMESFMGLRERFPLASFEDGIESLKMVLGAKKSSESHTFVNIE